MPTDTLRGSSRALSFALRAAAWNLGLFVVLRLNRVETHFLLPLTQLQGRLAVGLCGKPAGPVQATLECSGADALALCVGFILAYPVRWRMRLAGAAGGLALVLGLNTIRIGTLGRAAASPAWFDALHLYLWPAVLALAIAGYVFSWMRLADRRQVPAPGLVPPAARSGSSAAAGVASAEALPARATLRFALLTAGFLLVFTLASPALFDSAWLLGVAAFITRGAAAALRLIGVEASAVANVLATPRGRFLVTQECISTPLIAVYLAAILAYSRTLGLRALGLLAAAPLFVGLGVVRLMVVALPAELVASPLFLVHAFYQLLLAAVIVLLAAFWRHGVGGNAIRRATLGIGSGAAFLVVFGAAGARLVAWSTELLRRVEDPQGALATLPAFQVGLYLALWLAALTALGWRRFLLGLALLSLTQVTASLALQALVDAFGITPHVGAVRAWALAAPLVVIWTVWIWTVWIRKLASIDRAQRPPSPDAVPDGNPTSG